MVDRVDVCLGAEVNESFLSWGAVRDWLDHERQAWTWITADVDRDNNHSRVTNAFTNLRNLIDERQRQGENLSLAQAMLEEVFDEDRGPLLASESAVGQAVLEAASNYGPRSASYAYSLVKRWTNWDRAENRADMASALLALMPEWRKPSDLAHRLSQERTNYRNRLRSAEADITRLLAVNNELLKERTDKALRIGVIQLRKKRRQWEQHYSEIASSFAESKASIQAVEESYQTFMGLKAPVQYWKDKATGLAEIEGTAGCRLTWYFPIAFVVTAVAFGLAASLLINAKTVAQTVYFVVTGGLAVLSGLVFWIGRLLNRLYLSAHHLRIDAEERAVMTEAYLALTSENAATDADKQIILAALFRPTADGLVRDDGPDLTPAAILARVGMGLK